jgi:hypothetical protein
MTLMEQIDVVVNAPIPFFIVLVTVCGVAVVAIWRAFEWRYAAVLEKTRTLFDLAGQETEIVKRREAELNEVVKKQTNEIADLKNKAPAEVRPLIDALSATTATVNSSLTELGRANTAVHDTVTLGSSLTSGGVVVRRRGG